MILDMSEMNEQQPRMYQIADGEIEVWVDRGGAICIQLRTQSKDPAELAEHEAIALGELLIRLAKEQRE